MWLWVEFTNGHTKEYKIKSKEEAKKILEKLENVAMWEIKESTYKDDIPFQSLNKEQ